MFNLILFGPPGSGKGTQSEKLIAKYHLKHLSTGDILRSEIAKKSKLGLEAKKLMDKGELVPDEVVIGMINDALENNKSAKGFLFDGFPRTEVQAAELDKLLAGKKSSIALVLAMNVSEKELIKRLLKRGEASGRSDDANEEVIKARIGEYHKKTQSVLKHYQKEKKVAEIEGEGTIDEIFQRLAKAISKVYKEK